MASMKGLKRAPSLENHLCACVAHTTTAHFCSSDCHQYDDSANQTYNHLTTPISYLYCSGIPQVWAHPGGGGTC